MNQEEIRQGFTSAGWELDGSFHKYLIVGSKGDLSILAHRQAWEAEDPEFQLCDHENNLDYWVKEIVTPQRAAQLLIEHGKPVDEYF